MPWFVLATRMRRVVEERVGRVADQVQVRRAHRVERERGKPVGRELHDHAAAVGVRSRSPPDRVRGVEVEVVEVERVRRRGSRWCRSGSGRWAGTRRCRRGRRRWGCSGRRPAVRSKLPSVNGRPAGVPAAGDRGRRRRGVSPLVGRSGPGRPRSGPGPVLAEVLGQVQAEIAGWATVVDAGRRDGLDHGRVEPALVDQVLERRCRSAPAWPGRPGRRAGRGRLARALGRWGSGRSPR